MPEKDIRKFEIRLKSNDFIHFKKKLKKRNYQIY